MPKPTIYESPFRTNVILDKKLHDAAKKKAKQEGLRGGFSEYVARLLVADMGRKRSSAHRNGRFLKE